MAVLCELLYNVIWILQKGTDGEDDNYKYKRLQMDEEEVDVSKPIPRSRSPAGKNKMKPEDQVPLIED